jgi:hypothetical protein
MKVFLIIYGVLVVLGLIALAHGVATAVEVPQDVEI